MPRQCFVGVIQEIIFIVNGYFSFPSLFFSILVIISFGSCLQLPVCNYSKYYSGMCLLEESTGTTPQLNSDSLIHKSVTTKKDISWMSETSTELLSGTVMLSKMPVSKMLVSITVHYSKRIKKLQEVWSTHFRDCFGSITLCRSGLFLQHEETYTITTNSK